MKTWLRRVRGAIGMGLTWAAGWALFGILIGVSSILLPWLPWAAFFQVFDAPLPAMAVPGFFGGVIFSIVLGVAARRRTFDQLSLPRFAAWGALGGLLLSLVPAAMVGVGTATIGPRFGVWELTGIISGPLIVLCSASAAGSLMIARMGRRGAGRQGDLSAGEADERTLSAGAQGQLAAPAPMTSRERSDRSQAT